MGGSYSQTGKTKFYDLELETKPDFVACMKRIYAWYEGEILDRVPVRFSAHNEQFNKTQNIRQWKTLKDRWFDTEYQVESFERSLFEHPWLGETFPVFFPNLGPNFFAAAITGGELEFGEITSWCRPQLSAKDQLTTIAFREDNAYYQKIIEMTQYALERCEHKYMVGYTDMHPGLDCADALWGTMDLCMEMLDDPDFVNDLVNQCMEPFFSMMDRFHRLLKENSQLSVSWMNIPSYETMHIPSCDVGAMISQNAFVRYGLPSIQAEVKHFRHNVFHLDGKGVAKHVDELLKLPEIQAIQWAQGVGHDKPIMQWVGFIKKLQDAGKGIVVDLEPSELEDFIDAVSPKGIYLCISEKDPEAQQKILDRLLKWK